MHPCARRITAVAVIVGILALPAVAAGGGRASPARAAGSPVFAAFGDTGVDHTAAAADGVGTGIALSPRPTPRTTAPLDRALARWLNHQVAGHAVLSRLALWSATWMAIVFVGTLAVGWIVVMARDLQVRRHVSWRLIELPLSAGLALGVGLAINQVIGHIWFRPRPFDAIGDIRLLTFPSGDPSFPSDHATAAFALSIVILAAIRWLGALLLVETVLLLTGRVAVGLHYPGDALGGLLVALAAVAVADGIALRLRGPRRHVTAHLPPLFRERDPLPPPGKASRRLRAAGLGAAFLGLPFLIEAVADPIEVHPEWIEVLLLAVAAVALAALSLMLLRGPLRLNGTQTG